VILSINKTTNLIKIKFPINDVIKYVVKSSHYKVRARPKPDGASSIEDGAIDEEDKLWLVDIIKSGALRAHECLTFLTNGLATATEETSFSWNKAGSESANAVVFTLNYRECMSDNIVTMLDERIATVINQFALKEWFITNGMYEDAKVHMALFEEAKKDLQATTRLRKIPTVRPISFP